MTFQTETIAVIGVGFSPDNRSNHLTCSVWKGFLRNLAKFTGKHLCQSLFLNKVALLFSCEFCEISKNTFFTEHLWATTYMTNTKRLQKFSKESASCVITNIISDKKQNFDRLNFPQSNQRRLFFQKNQKIISTEQRLLLWKVTSFEKVAAVKR